METFAERLQVELDSRPTITRADIAEAAGATPQAVYGWLSGKYSISEDKARKIAALLGCSWLWLMHGETESTEVERFEGLPPAARDWLDRQARLVHEFESKHPLLAGMMFGDEVAQTHIQTAEEVVRLLENKSEKATASGSLIVTHEGNCLGIDRIAYKLVSKICSNESAPYWPATREMVAGREIYNLIPNGLRKDVKNLIKKVQEKQKEVARVLVYGELVVTVTVYPIDDDAVVFTLVDISDQLEIAESD